MMTVENIAEFNKMIADLDDSIKKEVMKKGYSAAAKPLIDAARANVPNIKRLQKSIGAIYYGDSNSAGVGARSSKRYAGFFANFYEEGTQERQTKTKTKIWTRKRVGHSTGKIGATHFWKKANDTSLQAVDDGMYQAFVDTYNKVVKKYEKYYK
jgi:hypothetical protein